jgi:hypothetical protein
MMRASVVNYWKTGYVTMLGFTVVAWRREYRGVTLVLAIAGFGVMVEAWDKRRQLPSWIGA